MPRGPSGCSGRSCSSRPTSCPGGNCSRPYGCGGGRCPPPQPKPRSSTGRGGGCCSSRSPCCSGNRCSGGYCYKESSSKNLLKNNNSEGPTEPLITSQDRNIAPENSSHENSRKRKRFEMNKKRAQQASSLNVFQEVDMNTDDSESSNNQPKGKPAKSNSGKNTSTVSSSVKQPKPVKENSRSERTRGLNAKVNRTNGKTLKRQCSNDEYLNDSESMDSFDSDCSINSNDSNSSSDDYMEQYFGNPHASGNKRRKVEVLDVREYEESTDDDSDTSEDEDFEYSDEDSWDSSESYTDYSSVLTDEMSPEDRDSADEFYHQFQDDYMHGVHLNQDDSNDSEFIPEDYDDVIIPKGCATTYKLTDDSIVFNSSSEIIELPKDDDNESSASSCPELVPIDSDEDMNVADIDTSTQSVKSQNDSIIMINSASSTEVLLLVKKRIYFTGCLTVKLVFGGAELFGYDMKVGETQSVYSIYGISSMYIEPTDRTVKDEQSLATALKSLKNFAPQDLNRIRRNCDPHTDTVLLLKKASNVGLFAANRLMDKWLVPPLASLDSSSEWFSSEFRLGCKFHQNVNLPLRIVDEWKRISLNQTSRVLLVGGKSVGKSTLLRYLINSNIRKFGKILLIDLDIGQPEVFVPQTVNATVISDPLLHPGYLSADLKPELSYLYGDISVVARPMRYMELVVKLLDDCSRNPDWNELPWIVNTMGYNKGCGSELMTMICRYLRPSDVIQFKGRLPNVNYPTNFTSETVNNFKFNIFGTLANKLSEEKPPCNHKFHELKSVRTADEERESIRQLFSSDFRTIRILVNLGQMLRHKLEYFTDVQPTSFRISDVHLTNFNSYEDLTEVELLEVINGNLVYLCETCEGSRFTKCHGIGIVRGIHAENIYILSSVPTDQMSRVNTIAATSMPLPDSVILQQNYAEQKSIFYAYESKSFIGSKKVMQYKYRPELDD